MPDRDVSAPYIEPNGPQGDDAVPEGGRPADSSNYDREGYDEAQRAEIAEAEGTNSTNGDFVTDLDPDMGEDLDEDEIEDNEDGLTTIIDTNGPMEE